MTEYIMYTHMEVPQEYETKDRSGHLRLPCHLELRRRGSGVEVCDFKRKKAIHMKMKKQMFGK